MMPDQERAQLGDVVTGPWSQPGTGEDTEIIDAEIVDDEQAADTRRPRSGARVVSAGRTAYGKAVQLAGDPKTRERARRIGAGLLREARLLADGWRHVRESGSVEHQLAHFHENNDPSRPVRPELADKYEAARQKRLDERGEGAGTAGLYVGGAAAGSELLWLGDITGALPAHGLIGPLVGAVTCVNAVGGPTVWAWLRNKGKQRQRRHELVNQAASAIDDTDAEIGADEITEALRDAGVLRRPTGSDPGQKVALLEPVSSDGQSWTARLALPSGITPGKVRARLSELASALDKTCPQILVLNGASERRLTLRVFQGRELPFTGAPVPSPLVNAESWDLARQGVPLGLDIDGQPVRVNLAAGRHGLVVASSGNGKTVLLQSIASATVLDPTGQLTLLDGKPDGAYSAYREVCWGFATTGSDGFEEAGATLLEAVADDMDERLARAERGEDIGGDHVVILDEFQEWTGNANGAGQKVGQPRFRMRAALERIARRGRAARVRLVLASQDYDGRTLDDGVLTNIGWRAVGYAPSKMSREALGELVNRYGLDTSEMFVDEVQAGAALVAGGGVQPHRSQRGYLQTQEDIAAVCATARRLQETRPQRQAADAGDPGAEVGELPPLLAALADYVAGDDRDVIATGELYEEANPEGLNPRAYGDALTAEGIPKITEGLRRPSRRVADIRRAVRAYRSRTA